MLKTRPHHADPENGSSCPRRGDCQARIPITHPVSIVARVPATRERRPRRARSDRLSGAIPPIPPIMIATEPKLANPQRA